jgi:hypothetical protein
MRQEGPRWPETLCGLQGKLKDQVLIVGVLSMSVPTRARKVGQTEGDYQQHLSLNAGFSAFGVQR